MSSTDYAGMSLSELANLAQSDDSAKIALAKALGIPVKTPKLGQIEIPQGKGVVQVYISDKGGIHFQGIPGASSKWGLTLYKSTLEFLFSNEDKLMDFMFNNDDKLSVKSKD